MIQTLVMTCRIRSALVPAFVVAAVVFQGPCEQEGTVILHSHVLKIRNYRQGREQIHVDFYYIYTIVQLLLS